MVVAADPGDVLVVVGGALPHAGDHGRVVDVAVRERGLVGTHSLHGAVDGIEVHRALDRRNSCTMVHVHSDGFVAEIAGKACFPVVLEAGREQRVEESVEGRIGHRADV